MPCPNCGADLPDGARFCPRCAAPVSIPEATPMSATARSWRTRAERAAFAVLAVLLAALVVLLVLVFGFGFLVEESS
jgi:predicted amidophosphoribosyltransferase